MARKQTTKVASIVTSLLYSAFAGNRHTRYGLEQEGPTGEAYIKEMSKLGKSVQLILCGLFIYKHDNCLSGSPDGTRD